MVGDFIWLIVDNLFRGLGQIVSATIGAGLCPELGAGQTPPGTLGCFIVQVVYRPFVEAFIRPIFTPGSNGGLF